MFDLVILIMNMTQQPNIAQSLEVFRQQGDELADQAVQQVAERLGIAGIRGLMPMLSDFTQLDVGIYPQELQDFYHKISHFPAFYKKKEVIRATNLYIKHQQEIGMVLGCYSLPYCYLGEDGARVLMASQRIQSDTYNRLKETGHFLRKVMNYDHWEDGSLFSITFKVRILHACIRYFTLHSGRWDAAWGVPINQEDMAGTNLAFSWILIKGLEKLGHSLDEVEERAYLHSWKVIGYLLGIDLSLLATQPREAHKLDRTIAERQFKSSEVGQALTKSLMACYTEMAGSVLAGEFFQAQSRLLLGETYADMLGIPKAKFPLSVLHAFNKSTAFLSNFYA